MRHCRRRATHKYRLKTLYPEEALLRIPGTVGLHESEAASDKAQPPVCAIPLDCTYREHAVGRALPGCIGVAGSVV